MSFKKRFLYFMSPEYNEKSFYILIIKGDFGMSPYFKMASHKFL